MVRPTLPVAPADLARVTQFNRAYPPQGVNPEFIQTTLELMKSADEGRISTWFHSAALVRQATSTDLLLMVIDASTGNSALHAAASVGNIDGIRAFRGMFRLGHRSRNKARLLHLLLTHQNAAGDTALHVAARNGHLVAVVSIYRIFNHDWLPGEPGREPGVELPAEDWAYSSSMLQAGEHIPALLFLATRNLAGRDAAAEAQVSGFDDITRWLQTVLNRLDAGGKRNSQSEMARMEQIVAERYRYNIENETSDNTTTGGMS